MTSIRRDPAHGPRPASRARILALAPLVLLAAVLGCETRRGDDATTAPVRLTVRSERIARLPMGYKRGSLASSRDQKRIGWVVESASGGSCRVVVDGVPGPDRRACTAPAFSRDGKTVASWATIVGAPGAQATVRLVVDSNPVGPDLVGPGDVRFAPTGSAWAASALLAAPPEAGTGGSARMRVFGPVGDLGTFRDTTAPVLDERGEHVAWIASDADDRRALWVDGRSVRDFGAPPPGLAAPLRVAREGPNLAPEEVVRWLVDGTLVGIVPSGLGWLVFHSSPSPAADGSPRDWAGHDVLWRSPQPSASDPALRVRGSVLLSGSLATAESAAVACWWERPVAGDRWRVVCNGKPVDDATCRFATGSPIAIAPSGKGVAYACVDSDGAGTSAAKTFVVANGRRLGPHVEVATIAIADGGHFAYAARDADDAAFFYVVDGRRVEGEWDEVFSPSFSPDGRHVAWGARREKGARMDLVLDGRVRTRADLVTAPPRIDDDGTASWVVRRGRNVLRISMTREPAARHGDSGAGPETAPTSGSRHLP